MEQELLKKILKEVEKIGELSNKVDRLEKKIDKIDELLPDALVIYTSDHGDMLGAHRLQMKNATAYKEVANIPLIIRGERRKSYYRAGISYRSYTDDYGLYGTSCS